MQRLKELRNDIYKCIHCKACRFAYSGEPDREGIGEHTGVQGDKTFYEGMVQACPAGIEFGWEAFWNAGKIWIARSVLEGDLDLKEHGQEIADVAFPCITCGMCGAQCENNVRTVDVIEALRAAVIEAGTKPLPVHGIMAKNSAVKDNPYGGVKEDRTKWAKDAGVLDSILNKKTKIAYYVGCTASYRQTNIAVATVKLLQKIGYDITILDKESCCGSPFFRTGLIDEAKRTMENNINLFKDFEVLMFSCAGCYRTFTIDYPKWTGKANNFKTIHAMELISELVRQEKIKFKEHPDLTGKTVTYHDPCHTGRHYGSWFKERLIEESKNLMLDMRAAGKIENEWFEVPRRIIKALPGVTFNEMYRIKMDSFCCGAGGGVRGQYPEFSIKTAHLRMDEGDAVGADIMLTECPFCWRNLDDANTQYNHGKKVMTILEMISTYELIESAEKIEVEEALRENHAEQHFPSNKKKK
ncbi:(Fe-S)-binding protein [Candidatus Lokiarchaeum ossiferum]|uniref:(Fe-S)-binding protein n=1 Tax=Candidatus Lokiarchaeum ossiferum TaxID=2951803 RepID=UPI00352E0EF3